MLQPTANKQQTTVTKNDDEGEGWMDTIIHPQFMHPPTDTAHLVSLVLVGSYQELVGLYEGWQTVVRIFSLCWSAASWQSEHCGRHPDCDGLIRRFHLCCVLTVDTVPIIRDSHRPISHHVLAETCH
jgi:hypothetical protein